MGGGSLSWWYVQQHALLLLRVQDAADCLRKGTADTCCSCVGGGPLSHRNYQGPMHHRKWRGLAVMITLQSTERCRTERLAAGAEHRSRHRRPMVFVEWWHQNKACKLHYPSVLGRLQEGRGWAARLSGKRRMKGEGVKV